MPAPFPIPRDGRPVNNQPSGFPVFFDRRQPRVVTADPWAFLEHLVDDRVDRAHRSAGFDYISQAFDFFEAARNPQLGSKPLLYYYSFLNLVKTALLIRKVRFAIASGHGISDPRANQRTRLRLEGQTVRIEDLAANHSQLFPEFVRTLGGDTNRRDLRVIQLFAQIPSIHRTFTRVTEGPPIFTPIKRVEVLRTGAQVWARAILDKRDKDVVATFSKLKKRRAFQRRFSQKAAPNDDEIWLETTSIPGQRRGVDGAIQTLAQHFREVGVSSILTSPGYRFYFCNIEPRHRLPRLAAGYAAFFYLGSITRYKPDVFDKILSGGYSWVVWELIATEPMQFLYTLASLQALTSCALTQRANGPPNTALQRTGPERARHARGLAGTGRSAPRRYPPGGSPPKAAVPDNHRRRCNG